MQKGNAALEPKTDMVSINPATGESLGRVPAVGRAGIDAAVKEARRAYPAWRATDIRQRQVYLKKLLQLIRDQSQEIARLIALEQGKPLTEALAAEVLSTLAILRYLARSSSKMLSSRRVSHDLLLFAHKKSYYHMTPYGVIAVISPWNFPFSVPLPQIAAAIVAGNTVVFKPAPHAVLIGEKINQLWQQAGLPHGVVNVTPVQDEDAPHLTEHAGVDKVIFTGSTETGKKVMC
ncbi:aldehyde dehydrogenase family protein, partial [candidate division KSB1 bacterium]|nr:aldehyde dehydrogenase family protein [candidate division KSB1 bacterium]